MEPSLSLPLAAKLDELSRERARLAELVRAYRVVRASRFARVRDLVLAAKRVVWNVDEAPAFAVLDLPAFRL